jgi:hypothetical protein
MLLFVNRKWVKTMIFKLVNKNPCDAVAYIQKDGYSRKIRPFGYVVLGELTAEEIAIYKKYKAVGLILETETGPASGVKAKDKVQTKQVQPKPEVKPEVKKVEEVKKEPEKVQEVKEEVQAHEDEVPECPPPEEVKEEKITKSEIDSMTSAELKEKAASVGVDTSKLKGKKELRDALKQFFFGV